MRFPQKLGSIRKAVVERGFPPALSALRTQRRRTKPLRVGPTAPSPMGIEWLDPRPLDASGGVFGVTEGVSHGRGNVAMAYPGKSPQEVLAPGLRAVAYGVGRVIMGHRPWRYVLLSDHGQSRIRHGSSPTVIHSARDIGGNSAATTIRSALHR